MCDVRQEQADQNNHDHFSTLEKGYMVAVALYCFLTGAIVDMIVSGVIGLFLGAVILTLGYTVCTALFDADSSSPQESVSMEK
jgi:uncharacterized membrane protein (DUF4010 family)